MLIHFSSLISAKTSQSTQIFSIFFFTFCPPAPLLSLSFNINHLIRHLSEEVSLLLLFFHVSHVHPHSLRFALPHTR